MKNAVIARMDELNSGMSENEIMPVLNIYLLDAANKFLRQCPQKYLIASSLPEGSEVDGFTHVVLPDDFLRLIEIKCKEWDMPIIETLDIEHPSFQYEKNKYLVRNSRPNVYLGALNGKRKLIFKKGEVQKAYYQKALSALPKMPEDMKDDMAWFIAGEMFVIFNEIQKAKIAYDRSNVLSYKGNIQGGQGEERSQGEA